MVTYAEIQALNRPDLIAARNETAIAELLSVNKTKTIPRPIGIGTVLETLGAGGGAFLDGMVSLGANDRNVFWAMKLLEAATLDIGKEATRTQMSQLAVAVPAIAASVEAILALAVVPDPVSAYEVAVALEGV